MQKKNPKLTSNLGFKFGGSVVRHVSVHTTPLKIYIFNIKQYVVII